MMIVVEASGTIEGDDNTDVLIIIPTFFLDGRVQEIRNMDHACEIARAIIDPVASMGGEGLYSELEVTCRYVSEKVSVN